MGAFTADGTENEMRWDGVTRGVMEAWYITLNHRASGLGLWFRYTLCAPEAAAPYCELWGLCFDPDGKRTFAAKRRFTVDHLAADGRDGGALVRIGDAWLSETHLEGALEDGERSLAWSLDLEPAGRCFQHLPARLRGRAERQVSTVCCPNLGVAFSGTVTLDGDELRLEGERGQQGHRWGRRHSLSWAWAHCSNFEGQKDAVFEGVAARAKLGPLIAPTTTFLYLRLAGEDIAFNDDLRWALRARSRYEMPTWAFTATNDRYRIAGAGRATLDRLQQVVYYDPDSSARYCANSEIADLAIELYERTGHGWRHRASLTALKSAHLEFGRKEPFAELPRALG